MKGAQVYDNVIFLSGQSMHECGLGNFNVLDRSYHLLHHVPGLSGLKRGRPLCMLNPALSTLFRHILAVFYHGTSQFIKPSFIRIDQCRIPSNF